MIKWKLRAVMADRRMTNKTLAKKLGLTPTAISNMKRVDRMPKINGEQLELLCEALDCEPGDLIELLSPSHPK